MTEFKAEQIRAAIERTSIPEEMDALFILANAVDMMCHNTYRRIKNVYRTNGFVLQENDRLAVIQNYCDMVRRAVLLFNQKIEPQVVEATFGEKKNVAGYDGFQDDSRELCQLILAYLDRTAKNKEAAERVFKMLNEIPSGGLFTDKDIRRYSREQHNLST